MSSQTNDQKKWIIDTDCGIDDAECIMCALHHLNVIAITCVAGNCDVDQAVQNVSKVLKMANKEVPIFMGCD